MTALAKRIKAERPDDYAPDWTLTVTPLRDQLVDPAMRKAMLVLLGAVGPRAADRLCQRREPPARARRRPLPRDRRARGARRVTRRPHSPAAHRERHAVARRRGARAALRAVGRSAPCSRSTRATCRRPPSWASMRRCSSSRCCSRCSPGSSSGSHPPCACPAPRCRRSLKEGGRGAAGDRGGLALRRGLVVATVAIALMLLWAPGSSPGASPGWWRRIPASAPITCSRSTSALPSSRYPNDTVQDRVLRPRHAGHRVGAGCHGRRCHLGLAVHQQLVHLVVQRRGARRREGRPTCPGATSAS